MAERPYYDYLFLKYGERGIFVFLADMKRESFSFCARAERHNARKPPGENMFFFFFLILPLSSCAIFVLDR